MNDRPVTTVRSSIWTVALASLASLFAIVAFHFALQQSVWTDEATQLSGLSLSFLDQLRWLSGRLPQAFSVPPDRTPPLSYWLGSLWTSAFGDRVLTTRCLSVCLSIVSVFALWGGCPTVSGAVACVRMRGTAGAVPKFRGGSRGSARLCGLHFIFGFLGAQLLEIARGQARPPRAGIYGSSPSQPRSVRTPIFSGS